MNLSAFENPGKFWRGNIHTHSNLSDGLLDPGEVCRRYKNQGYDFISVTDHFIGLYDYPLTDTSALEMRISQRLSVQSCIPVHWKMVNFGIYWQ